MGGVRATLDAYDLLLMILHSSKDCNRISGRTALQKIGYFSVNKLKIENDYSAHYYGPYSPQIAYALERLVSLNLVKENEFLTHNERTMYSYELTEEGRKYCQTLLESHKREYRAIKKIVEVANEIDGDKIDVISRAAKVHYITKRAGQELPPSDLTRRAESLGWSLSNEQIQESNELLKELKASR